MFPLSQRFLLEAMKILGKVFLAQRSLERSHTHSIFCCKKTEDDMAPGHKMFFSSQEHFQLLKKSSCCHKLSNSKLSLNKRPAKEVSMVIP